MVQKKAYGHFSEIAKGISSLLWKLAKQEKKTEHISWFSYTNYIPLNTQVVKEKFLFIKNILDNKQRSDGKGRISPFCNPQ